MHLNTDFIFKGVNVPNCMICIGAISIAEDRATMTFAVNYKAGEGFEPLQSEYVSCPYDDEDDAPEKQAYRYLLTLSDFKGASLTE